MVNHTTTQQTPAIDPIPPSVPRGADGKSAALEILRRGVSDIVSSNGWRRALAFRQRFHRYSFFNSTLILAQRPDATLVAGYRAWQKSNRQVRRGERGITIMAPLHRRDPHDTDRLILTGFRTAKVFDISQTEGEPVPTYEPPQLLRDTQGDQHQIDVYHHALVRYCHENGCSIRTDVDHPHAMGYYRPSTKEIGIRDGLSRLHAFKTLAHETAHMLLHNATDHRSSAELEAETAAFLVCHALGIDTSSYSFRYLAHWSDSIEALIGAGERGNQAATTILNGIHTATPQPHGTDTASASCDPIRRTPLQILPKCG